MTTGESRVKALRKRARPDYRQLARTKGSTETVSGLHANLACGRDQRVEHAVGSPMARRPIPIACGTGEGATELVAFDAALVDAGVADRKLIVLTSVLPPGSAVDRVGRIADTPGGWGDRLYCVLAEGRTSEPGTEVWAGIGWIQDETGRGLLVEHHAPSKPALSALIEASLRGLGRNRKLAFPHTGAVIAGAHCTGTAVCALVVAAFAAEPWPRTADP